MTQQMPGGAPPQQQQMMQPQQVDPLTQTIVDLQRDRQRLAKSLAGEVTPSKLGMEINDTVLSYLDETLRHLANFAGDHMRLRHWLNQVVPELGARVEDLEEGQDDGGGLDEELLGMILKIIEACKNMTTMALGQIPDDGKKESVAAKAQLQDLLSLCDAAWEQLGADDADDDDEDRAEHAPSGNGAAS